MEFRDVKRNFFTGSTWMRGLLMALYVLLFGIAKMVLAAVVVFQFGSLLFIGHLNTHLLSVGQSLSIYCYQIFLFLTYNSDDKPFPLSSWPKSADAPKMETPTGNTFESAQSSTTSTHTPNEL